MSARFVTRVTPPTEVTRRLALVFALIMLVSCSDSPKTLPPRGQVLLFIDTDAPLADSTVATGRLSPLPLFDHLRLDVYACADVDRCKPVTRDFEIDADRLRSIHGVSLGIVPSGADVALVRARLFLGTVTAGDDPPLDVTIDVTAAMPEVAVDGVVEATLFLPTDQVGIASSDLAHPVTTIEGRPSPSKVGSWPLAQRSECDAPPASGEVCVPGGAYWMGSALLKDFRLWQDHAADARRLVALSPFYIDAHEVTVADYRASGLTVTASFSGSTAGTAQTDWCTFTKAIGPHENRPVNCLSRAQAQAYCQSLGKDFPTEAQFEYVAGGLAEQLWPWGADSPSCSDAVLGRAVGPFDPADPFPSSACLGAEPVEGPLDVATAMRDFSEVPGSHGGRVYDLVGNLSEYALDIFQFRDDLCWARRGLYVDPLCSEFGATAKASLMKGGNFWWVPSLSFSPMRFPVEAPEADPLWGFRCARRSTLSR